MAHLAVVEIGQRKLSMPLQGLEQVVWLSLTAPEKRYAGTRRYLIVGRGACLPFMTGLMTRRIGRIQRCRAGQRHQLKVIATKVVGSQTLRYFGRYIPEGTAGRCQDHSCVNQGGRDELMNFIKYLVVKSSLWS